MTRMDYERHGDWWYGRNREIVVAMPKSGGVGPRYVVVRASNGSCVATFEVHEQAAAEAKRLQRASGEPYVIRKY